MSKARERVILIEREGVRSRAALLVGGRLEDLLIDPPEDDTTPNPGEIYRAKIDRLVPKQGAAFLRLGPDRMGYLREARGLREGQTLLVQVVSYPEDGKASPVTRRILYKGRRVIHTPEAPGINVSRQIRDTAERARLTAAAERALAERAAETGLILRSAAAGATDAALCEEITDLCAARAMADGAAQAAGPPTRVGDALSAAALAMREWDGKADMATGAFEAHGVLEEIDRLRGPRIELPSGAWMSVEPTRACIAIDVNTGAEFGGAAALTANLEAAREIPRQLRLRGLGGQIVVDFAPIAKKDRHRIEDALKTSLRHDPIETSLVGWTGLGLFEIQRKRERRPLGDLV